MAKKLTTEEMKAIDLGLDDLIAKGDMTQKEADAARENIESINHFLNLTNGKWTNAKNISDGLKTIKLDGITFSGEVLDVGGPSPADDVLAAPLTGKVVQRETETNTPG